MAFALVQAFHEFTLSFSIPISSTSFHEINMAMGCVLSRLQLSLSSLVLLLFAWYSMHSLVLCISFSTPLPFFEFVECDHKTGII